MRQDGLLRAVTLADLKLREKASADRGLILVLLDADEDRPCELGPQLLSWLQAQRPDLDVACVLATPEYETWFVAAARSLGRFLELPEGVELPPRPEESRSRKAWIEERFRGPKYSETLDQPRLTAAMDLALCRQRSPSFDKLCRELASRKGF